MGDSDDEYDRKRRDKFRGERSTTEYRGRRDDDRRGGGRDDWNDRNRPRPDYRDYRGRERYSPGRDLPPVKRMRGEWMDDRSRFVPHDPYGGMYGGFPPEHYPGYAGPYPAGPPLNQREPPNSGDMLTQPSMMTLKQFLATQDDSISDSDAITKYNEYKLEFRRQQLNEFFVAHKDEEWFKIKYHPEESLKRKEEQIGYLKKRIDVFIELLEKGEIAKIFVDTTNTEQLLRLLDTVVIKLEGGTDDDLKVLDEKPIEINQHQPKQQDKSEESGDKVEDAGEKKTGSNQEDNDEEKEDQNVEKVEKKTESKKRKRSHSSSSSSSSSSSDSDDSDSEKDKNSKEEKEVKEKSKSPEPAENGKNEEKAEELEDGENNDDSMPEMEKDDKAEATEENEDATDEKKSDDDKIVTEVVDLVKEEDKPKALQELHKTSSIFLRNLAPTITKAEVEALCKRYDGFLRVAIADPLVERRWFRRGWVTFKRDVNIKEICWNLNNIRLRDCELGAIVNRDLSRRVRPVNGVTAHKTVCKSDIKLCAKIAHSLDEKAGLWKEELEKLKVAEDHHTFGLKSNNPVLKNITDYLIDEASAEEEELLGMSADSGKDSEGELLERDNDLITVLDKIILYLRIVHSVDFYNHCEYPYEDEMPNRCGIIHARGPAPQNKITQTEIQDYIKNFESKMSQFLASSAEIQLEELKKLGAKNMDDEVEKFVSANSQELAKDKWLCPLSGKKFKGPDYIRKHIFNKHAEKVEEVKKEVEYFNNYLKDPKRPQLPEHPSKKDAVTAPAPVPGPGYRPYPAAPPYHAPYSQMMAPRGRNFGRGRGGHPAPEYRPVIHYRDLDAPREPDEFV